jgi:NAD(P)-dependent dehydrogenase (short-subunit alcohol dehydrogenase family)
MPEALAGRHALVTGASSGIGRAIALALAGAGATTWLTGRDGARLDAVRDLVRETGGAAESVPADLLDAISLAGLVSRFDPDRNGPDLLVHSAGACLLGALAEASVDDLDLQWRVNARAPWVLTQALLPALRERRGAVVFVNSGAGNRAHATWGAYAMSKHALRALADSLREEEAGSGVRVVSVYPGRTATPMQEAVHGMEGREYRPELFVQPEDVARVVLTAVTMPPSAVVPDVSVRAGRS